MQKKNLAFSVGDVSCHIEPVGPCRLDVLAPERQAPFNAFCPVGGLQTRWPCPPAHESRTRAHHRWAD